MPRTAVWAWLLSASVCAAGEPPVEFNRDVRPILSDACYRCHGPDAKTRQAGVRLDTPAGLTAKRAGGHVVAPGKPADSLLVERVTSRDADVVMPPPGEGKKLTAQQIDTLTRWVAQGASYEGHWAFEPVKRTPGDLDRHVDADLARHKLAANPEADRVTLVRRLSFDLVGLPPTPEEVAAVVADASPGWYERVVDRLLASPHYGERMALLWLDLVRYADSAGYHGDQPVNVAPYRDWVVRAFNANQRFDRFTLEQLAGDLLPNPTLDQQVAAGYNRLGMMSAEGGVQPREYLAKYAAERVRNVSGAWLGVTVGCAECHDHKFDPFSAKDFYRLQAFFADIQEQGIYPCSSFGPEIAVPDAAQAQELARRDADLAAARAKADARPELAFKALAGGHATTPERREVARLDRGREAFVARLPKTLVTKAVAPRQVRVLARGNWMDATGEVVQPGFPAAILDRPAKPGERLTRLDLARWLTDPANPLTARAFVNRLWKMYFGVGLSKKLDDLGSQGEWPTHPELLDDLAAGFVASGWDVKAAVRRIVTSRAYRRSSRPTAELTEKDPENRRLARQGRFRLDAELVRDAALSVSGLLNTSVGGPSAKPYQPPRYWAYLNFPAREWQNDTGDNLYRRGLYTHWQRQYLHPSLLAFDAPNREECTAERVRSNTPLQALALLNDPTYVEAARVFAEKAVGAAPTDAERVDWLFRRALSRPATPAEREVVIGLLEKHRREYAADPAAASALLKTGAAPLTSVAKPAELAAWTAVARAVLNLHGAITRY